MAKVSALAIYPCKSTIVHKLQQAQALETGFQGDRELMLVDDNGKFISQRSLSAMARLKVGLDGGVLSIAYESKEWQLSLPEERSPREVSVWSDTFLADDLGDELAVCLSDILGVPLRMVGLRKGVKRLLDSKYTAKDVAVSFADGFPYLIANQGSLDDLNARLAVKGHEPVGMNRFRPNIVLDGLKAYEEDEINRLRIGKAIFRLAKPCTRCKITTLDEQSLRYGKEPLKTLMEYRYKEDVKGACFGQNAFLEEGHTAVIRENDTVEILD